VDYAFVAGTSIAGPHVAGVVALMLQKNPGLTASQIEDILEDSALPLAPGCRDVTFPVIGPGDFPTFSDHDNVSLIDAVVCWGADAPGHGVVQADKALAAVPSP
jgi:serine protease AprX